MIKFGKIISEAGYTPKDFPKLSEMTITLFDQKKRNLEEDSFNFRKKLFSKNLDSQKKFRELLENLMKKDIAHLTITGRLTDDVLILYVSAYALPQIFILF